MQSLASALNVLAPTMTVWCIADATREEREAWETLIAWRRILNPTPSDAVDARAAGGRYG